MDTLSILVNAFSPSTERYSPYTLRGDFDDSQSETIKVFIESHFGDTVSAGFNYFVVSKYSRFFSVKRLTWDNASDFDSFEEMMSFLEKHCSKRPKLEI